MFAEVPCFVTSLLFVPQTSDPCRSQLSGRALRFVPKIKGVVLGLISTKTPTLESLDTLKRRIEDAARYIDLDRLAIGPQCGFASTFAGNPLTETDERAKLALAVQAASSIWQ